MNNYLINWIESHIFAAFNPALIPMGAGSPKDFPVKFRAYKGEQLLMTGISTADGADDATNFFNMNIPGSTVSFYCRKTGRKIITNEC